MSTADKQDFEDGATELYRPKVPFGGVLGRLLAMGYRQVIAGRNRRFDAGRGVVEIDRPVVSVGNLSTGGTGKTPTVIWLVERLRAAGFSPCVAMRGYGGGKESDEALVYSARLPGLKVVAQVNRVDGLLELFASEGEDDKEGTELATDVVVLDDGFQHRKLARDFDLVLIDATRPPFEDRLLPAGHLREGMESLGRAHGVLITRVDCVDPLRVREIRERVLAINPRLVVACGAHRWRGLDVLAKDGVGGNERRGAEWLRGKRVCAVCAIGNPMAFVRGIGEAGAKVVGKMVLGDHATYGNEEVSRLVELARGSGAEVIMTTEKDWSKLQRVRAEIWPVDVARPRLEMEIDDEEAFAGAVIARVREATKRKLQGE